MPGYVYISLGVPLGLASITFLWLFSRGYLKLLEKREDNKREELAIQRRQLELNEKKAEKEWEYQEKEFEFKFKMLDGKSQTNLLKE